MPQLKQRVEQTVFKIRHFRDQALGSSEATGSFPLDDIVKCLLMANSQNDAKLANICLGIMKKVITAGVIAGGEVGMLINLMKEQAMSAQAHSTPDERTQLNVLQTMLLLFSPEHRVPLNENAVASSVEEKLPKPSKSYRNS